MAVAGIGLYLFFKKKSTTAPIVPPTTGGGSELLPIAPSLVYEAPVQPIYAPSEPVYIEPTQPSPISALSVFTNPISDIISLVPVQQYPSAPIYEAPVQPAPAPIYQAPVYKPEPIYEAPVYRTPEPVYEAPVQPAPAPVYYIPTPVYYEPDPIYQPEPEPVFTPKPTPVYYEPTTPVYGGSGPYYIPEQIGAGSGGLFDFFSNQVWLQNLTSFQMESYLAVDTITKDQSDQA